MKKGLKSIVIIIAVLFLLIIITNLFLNQYVDVDVVEDPYAYLVKGCSMAINNGCKPEVLNKNICSDIFCIKKVDLGNKGFPDTLMTICEANGIANSTDCLRRCGCTV